jgi:hypothetical protein
MSEKRTPGTARPDAPKPAPASGKPSMPDKPPSPGNPKDPAWKKVPEIGGPEGPEPTRYGDWERKGRVSDF